MLATASTVLALAIAVQAAPAPASQTSNLIGSTAFSAEALHQDVVRNGTAAMLKAYAKHHLIPTKEMPAAFLDHLAKRQNGAVSTVLPSS